MSNVSKFSNKKNRRRSIFGEHGESARTLKSQRHVYGDFSGVGHKLGLNGDNRRRSSVVEKSRVIER